MAFNIDFSSAWGLIPRLKFLYFIWYQYSCNCLEYLYWCKIEGEAYKLYKVRKSCASVWGKRMSFGKFKFEYWKKEMDIWILKGGVVTLHNRVAFRLYSRSDIIVLKITSNGGWEMEEVIRLCLFMLGFISNFSHTREETGLQQASKTQLQLYSLHNMPS